MIAEHTLEIQYGGAVNRVFQQIQTFFSENPSADEMKLEVPFANDSFIEFLFEKLRRSENDFWIERLPDTKLFKTVQVYRTIPEFVSSAWLAANRLRYNHLVGSLNH